MSAKNKKSLRRSALHLQPISDGRQLDDARKALLADWCRLIGQRLNGDSAKTSTSVQLDTLKELTPRLRQTLSGLLAGDSEKQIAVKLQLSQHTVHTYVKQLHKRFDVVSRGELLARFVQHPV